MDTKAFLDSALGNDGYYCLFANNLGTGHHPQMFFNSTGELLDAANEYDAKGYDAYFALCTFKDNKSRKATNGKQLKSFFLDIDCGEGKDYDTQTEAVKALAKFCKTVRLPRPLLVNSGRGVHVYWNLTDTVCPDDWKPVATRLKKLCKEHAFKCDNSVTSDCARVLRIPQTHNHKTTPPTPVGHFGTVPTPVDFDKFSDILGIDQIPVPTRRTAGSNAVMAALTPNYKSYFKDILTKSKAGRGCEQLMQVLREPNSVSEPTWFDAVSIVKHCEDGGRSGAHRISKGYDGYDPEETDKKYDTTKHVHLCSSFDANNPDICQDCPNWGKIKSPITLGNRVEQATAEDNVVEVVVEAPALDLPDTPTNTYVIPEYPKPYFRGKYGGIYTRTTDPEGEVEEKLLYHNDLYVVRRLRDAEIGEAIVMRLHLPKDGVREFTVPLTAVTSRDEFRKHMSMQGVAVTRMDELMQYTTTWVNELQATAVADEAHRQFGWSDDKRSSFILGNQEVTPQGVGFNPPSSSTASMFHIFEPKGTLDQWKKNAEFYNRDGFEMHQYIVATAFGSVLMDDSPISCAGFHVHSKASGIGKTTAMYMAASVWGNPKEYVLEERDTYASRMNRGEIYHNLPLYIDELTNAKGEELSNLAYQLSGGKQRSRMSGSSNNERLRGKAWSLLSVSTGNTSFVERISMFKDMPKAEAQRIMETRAVRKFFTTDEKEITDEFATSVNEVYGVAGVPYVQHLMANSPEASALRDKVQKNIDREAGLTAENRYWSAGAASTLAGAIIAKRIGLINYDIPKLTKYVIGLLKENLMAVQGMDCSASDTLNDYIHENWGSILKIKSTDDLRKGNGNGLDTLIIPELDPKIRLVGRYETDIKRAYLIPKALKNWCAKQQINYGSFIQDLKDNFDAKSVKMRLTKGTSTQLPPSTVIAVDCAIGETESDDSKAE